MLATNKTIINMLEARSFFTVDLSHHIVARQVADLRPHAETTVVEHLVHLQIIERRGDVEIDRQAARRGKFWPRNRQKIGR